MASDQRLFFLSRWIVIGLDVFLAIMKDELFIIRRTVAVNIHVHLELALLPLAPGVCWRITQAVLAAKHRFDAPHYRRDFALESHREVSSPAELREGV